MSNWIIEIEKESETEKEGEDHLQWPNGCFDYKRCLGKKKHTTKGARAKNGTCNWVIIWEIININGKFHAKATSIAPWHNRNLGQNSHTQKKIMYYH